MSVTQVAIQRPLLICTLFTALILFGIIGYNSLDYNLLPSFAAGVVTIETQLPGASPSDIQTEVTIPIENAIGSVSGIQTITSSSLENVSVITVDLLSGVDDKEAQKDIERKISQIISTLPDDIKEPIVNRMSTDDVPVLDLTVTSNLTAGDFDRLIQDHINPRLNNVTGVGQINVTGSDAREIEVLLDKEKMQMYGLSPKQIYSIIAANTMSNPGGDVNNANLRFNITINADYTDVSLLPNIEIKNNGQGSRILLKDVAVISDAQQRTATLNRINGKPGVGIQILKTEDANAVDVSKNVKTELENLKHLYAQQQFDYAIASDESVYTLNSANAVIHDLFNAVLIVSFVMLLFLHSLRSSMFVLIAIPSAMIPTFIVMQLLGFSLNLMTLLALSLVVGILVDDSIVILENIFRHIEMGKDKRTAALDGRTEIGFTAVAITFVDVVVFLPMAFAGGLIGNILNEFALVVVASTLMSLTVAFTLTPMMASRFAKPAALSRATIWGRIILGFEDSLNNLKDFYAGRLRYILSHKKYFLAFVFLLMAGSIMLVVKGFIGASFTGTNDRGELAIQLETTPDMPLYQTNLLTKKAEEIVMNQPEVTTVYTLVGTQTGAKGNAENIAELSVSLVDKRERTVTTDEFGLRMRNEIEKIPGLQVTVIPTSVTGQVNAPIQIVVNGNTTDDVYKAAQQVKAIAEATAGSDYVRFSTKQAVKQVQITPDRNKIALLGLNLPDVAQSIEVAFNGVNKLNFIQGDDTYQVNVEIDQNNKLDMDAVANMPVTNSAGGVILLRQVADIKEITAQNILERTNRQPSITVTSSAVGRPSGTIVSDIQKSLAKVKFAPGIEISFQGDAKNQSDAFKSLYQALIIAIVLVYMVMVSLYESLIYPFVVIFSVPVALIGALLALALTMNQLTIFTLVGMIMLLGLVTKNAILIVDFTNHLKQKGTNTLDAVVQAGRERLRPIIMTTFAMVLGMLPLAFSKSPGSEFKNGMAWVLIGGLTSSFLLTLFIVPTMYIITEKLLKKFSKNKIQETDAGRSEDEGNRKL